MATNYLHFSNPLERAVAAGDEDRLVAELENVKSHRTPRKSRELMLKKILSEAQSSKIRNAAAIAIADMRIANSDKWIIETLERPELAKSSGTLLYALSELKAYVPIDVLINLIEHGSYEAKSEALMFFENGRVKPFDNLTRKKSINKLQNISSSLDEDSSEIAETVLMYLDKNS